MATRAPLPVSFPSGGASCAGDLWLPASGTDGGIPIVVLGHGLGGTRAMGLASYAERFAAAGIGALTFDYRHFGDSGGEPRRLISVSRQLRDWEAAVRYARSLDAVDPRHVAIWGTSFGGGHVLSLAARDHSLAAVVAQCPFTDGLASSLTLGPRSTAKVAAAAIADQLAAWLGRDPVRVAVAGPPGSAALMTAPDAMPGYRRLAALADDPDPHVAARIALAIGLYRPGRTLARITTPTLICVCDPDSVAPTAATERHVRRAANAHIAARTYPCGHFEIYLDEPFERAVADQVEFLRDALARPAVPDPARAIDRAAT